ncbi:MAG: carboxypeptidase-like regulatory domain-containing protein [Gemmatimonadaceae bacterium]
MQATKSKLVGAFLLLGPLAACTGESAVPRGANGEVVDSSAGTVVLGIRGVGTYRPAVLGATGSLAGSISREGTPPDDSTVAVNGDSQLCGDSASVTRTSSNGGALGNVLVWIVGVTAGKSPPEVRRETLTIEDCVFEPRLMAVMSGTTINLLSRDHTTYTSRFYREGAGEPVDAIHTVDAGQVVPSEKIAAKPGIVEARRTPHPWARAYIAVFDHPYFAVTNERGDFTIDSLPPGTYTVKVWHERLEKPVEQRIVVGPRGTARIDAALTLK